MTAARGQDGTIELNPATRKLLQSAHRSEEAGKPTRLGATSLASLRLLGLAYTTNGPRGRFTHLTKRGREALGVPAGLAR